MRPFTANIGSEVFHAQLKRVLAEIDNLENDYVLKASPTELEQHFIARVNVDPLVLHVDQLTIDEPRHQRVPVNDYGRVVHVAAVGVDVTIPFSGDPELWKLRASTYHSGGYPEISVRNGEITFPVIFKGDELDPERMRAEIDKQVKALAEGAGWIGGDAKAHNASVLDRVRQAVDARCKRARSAFDAVGSLGLPIRRRAAPATYVAPVVRRPTPVSRPAVAAGKAQPEPTLDSAEYEFILGVLRSMAHTMERSPAAFSTLDEEALRTHFLLQLNGHYEGSATGETFNAGGKTDILIRVNDRNIFIAECKFWRGVESFNAAIEQLLGYMSWRDSKCALLVFNHNKDSSAVQEKVHAAMQARPEHRRTVSHSPESGGRYVFVKASDPGREVHISTMLFDVPRST